MHSVSQEEATRAMPTDRIERTRFWRDSRFLGMECLTATFITHEFQPHSHDTFSIGAIEAGCQVAMIRGMREATGPGALYLINPGEMHDGQPGTEGYRYRMIYPDIRVFTDILEEATGRVVQGTPSFSRQLLSDPQMAAAFNAAHARLEDGSSALESEESLYSVLAAMFVRHGSSIIQPRDYREPHGVRRARDYIEARFDAEIGLEELAREAGLSRAHLIRAFRKHYFITPHAFQTDLRVRHARRLLRAGQAPSEVAAACGFADQAHLTRHFKARTGLTPAKYRVA